jgi:hypothetical protein
VTQPLEPRYRRLLTFGDVLDESLQLFRHHWITYATVSAIALIPPGLAAVWLSASGALGHTLNLSDFQTGRFASDPALVDPQLPAQFGASIGSSVFELVWTAAVVFTTVLYLRGEPPKVSRVYGQAARCFLTLLVGSLLFGLGMVALSLVAALLMLLTVFLVGSLIALIALLFWWLRPGARKAWVKWLIIATTPFGLPIYFSIRWSMFAVAAVVEGHGPVGSLKRSSALVERQVFRVLGILAVTTVIVVVLVDGPAALIAIPLSVVAAARGELGLNPMVNAVSEAVSVVLRILFASVGLIVYTLLFFDLRNRREGTDMVERLTQLEAAPFETNG